MNKNIISFMLTIALILIFLAIILAMFPEHKETYYITDSFYQDSAGLHIKPIVNQSVNGTIYSSDIVVKNVDSFQCYPNHLLIVHSREYGVLQQTFIWLFPIIAIILTFLSLIVNSR